jgi:hypothetical protein
MKAYHISLLLIMFSVSIIIVNSSGIFGDVELKPYDGPDILGVIAAFAPSTTESLTYNVIAISAFGLLVYTLSPIVSILIYSTILMGFYLPLLGLPYIFTTPLMIGTWISFIVGYNQYKGRTSLREQE